MAYLIFVIRLIRGNYVRFLLFILTVPSFRSQVGELTVTSVWASACGVKIQIMRIRYKMFFFVVLKPSLFPDICLCSPLTSIG